MDVKTVKLLAYVTGPVALAALFWPGAGSAPSHALSHAKLLLPGIGEKLDAAAQLTYTSADATLHLFRAPVKGKPDAGWKLREKDGYPVPDATIKPVLEGLKTLHGVEPKTERPKLYARLMLENPGKGAQSRGITLADAEGKPLADVVLGKTKPDLSGNGPERMYARVPGAEHTWLAEPSINPPTETLGWIDHAIVDIPADRVKHVILTPVGGKALDYARDKPDAKLALTTPPPAGAKLKDDAKAADVGSSLATLELTDVRAADQLKGASAGTVHAETFDGLTIDLTLTKAAEQTWIVVNPSGKGAEAIAARTKGWAYAVSDPRAGNFTVKIEDVTENPAAPPAK